MYSWIWRKLPGGIPGKLLGCLVLLFATVMLLFLVVFPWASPKLPFNHVTIDTTPTPSPTTTSTSTAPAVPD
ncbi:MAG TPA: hypothetical protein VHD81_02160 [Mycobacteriales bacterium]|nr:hypothetical protein [Mycobacteriales bacterium]